MFELDEPFSNNDFISIVILSFQRPEHTKNLLKSIHVQRIFEKVPHETILVDDASFLDDTQSKLFNEMRQFTSTIIFNHGVNRGFTHAANQAVALSSSKYILLLNNDMEMVKCDFPRIVTALQAPYIGCLGVMGGAGREGGPVISRDGVNVELNSNPKGSGAFAFRKDLWEELGGFPERHHSAADIGFFYSALKAGYFNGFLVDSEKLLRNVDQEEGYASPTEGTTRFANGYPRLFGVSKEVFIEESLKRKHRILQISQADDKTSAGINNIQYWSDWFAGIHVDGKIQWGSKFMFGHEKWWHQVEGDIK